MAWMLGEMNLSNNNNMKRKHSFNNILYILALHIFFFFPINFI